jgi:hypothetical protein
MVACTSADRRIGSIPSFGIVRPFISEEDGNHAIIDSSINKNESGLKPLWR